MLLNRFFSLSEFIYHTWLWTYECDKLNGSLRSQPTCDVETFSGPLRMQWIDGWRTGSLRVSWCHESQRLPAQKEWPTGVPICPFRNSDDFAVVILTFLFPSIPINRPLESFRFDLKGSCSSQTFCKQNFVEHRPICRWGLWGWQQPLLSHLCLGLGSPRQLWEM